MIKAKATFRGLKRWRVPLKTRSIATNPTLGIYAASEMAKGMNKFVPMREGFLSSIYTISPFNVHYIMMYARYMYYDYRNYNYSTHLHPQATGYWDRAFSEENGHDLGFVLTQYLRSI